MCPQSMFCQSKNKKNIQKFSAASFQFVKLKNLCLLHGQVFVMIFSQQIMFKPFGSILKQCKLSVLIG